MRAVAGVALSGLLGLAAGCGGGSVITPGGGPTTGVVTSPSPGATVFSSMDEACRDERASSTATPSAPSRPGEEGPAMRRATADADALSAALLDRPGIESVGVGMCVGPVVVVGVSGPTASVPATGARGTPVVAVRMGPFVAS